MTDYSVEAQPASEDLANALMMLGAPSLGYDGIEDARRLLESALAKLRARQP